MTSYDITRSKSDAALAPPLRTSASIKYIGVSTKTNVDTADTETVFTRKTVPEVSKLLTPDHVN